MTFGTAWLHRPIEGFIGQWDLVSCVGFGGMDVVSGWVRE